MRFSAKGNLTDVPRQNGIHVNFFEGIKKNYLVR
jgi:hypothetical protein